VRSFDLHEAAAISPRRIDQFHLIKCQIAAFHNPNHLTPFRQQAMFPCIGSLGFGPSAFLKNLVTLCRIGRIPGTADACEFGRAHVSHSAGSSDTSVNAPIFPSASRISFVISSGLRRISAARSILSTKRVSAAATTWFTLGLE
jgi:hypothetical protein